MHPTTIRRSGMMMLATGALAAGTVFGGAPALADQPVTIATLDTGSYPTTPRAPFGNSVRDEVAFVEGQRMGDYVSLPGEIDDDLVDVTMPTFVVRSRQNLAALAGQGAADIPANDHLLTGFIASAASEHDFGDEYTAVTHGVLRYATPEAAADAARQLNDADIADGGQHATIGGLENSHVNTSVNDIIDVTQRQYTAFTAHGPYVVWTWAAAPESNKKWAEKAVRTALEKQLPLLDDYVRTPTKAENGGSVTPVPIDPSGVLVYTLPGGDPNEHFWLSRTDYSPRGYGHVVDNGLEVSRALTAAGATVTAWDASKVHRAATADKAESLQDKLIDLSEDAGYRRISSPSGLDDATCLSHVDGTTTEYTCYVTVGRYVGVIDDASSVADAHQQISAQYVLLTKAPQH